jgi:uncharacterized protein YjbI with pentapeptide repeats
MTRPPGHFPPLQELDMSTTWMASLGGLPGVGVVVLAVSLGVLGLISYCRAGAARELPAQRDLLEFCAGQLSAAAGPAQVRPIIDALDALGQADPTARQAVLDIVCGYLRRPAPSPAATVRVGTVGPAARMSAQAFLHRRLVPQRGGAEHWLHLHLNLSGASVQDLDLRGAGLRSATFVGTRFCGVTQLSGARVAGRVELTDAVFTGPVLGDDVDFNGPVRCTGACFDTTVSFTRTTFRGLVDFAGARFAGAAEFGSALFLGDAAFAGADRGPALFAVRAGFEQTRFTTTTFAGVCWPADTSFHHAEFAQSPHGLVGPPADTTAVPACGA